MTGIPVSPWMIPTQRPVQKNEVKDINKAWATDQKRHLYVHLYDFTSRTGTTTCNTCNSMPDDIKPTNFPSNECSDLYEYLKWDYETKGYNRGKNWFLYDSLSAADQRQLWYDYYEWQKETTAIKVARSASSYVTTP